MKAGYAILACGFVTVFAFTLINHAHNKLAWRQLTSPLWDVVVVAWLLALFGTFYLLC